ncbi:MAG: hypothetical protein F6K35_50370, partial [Okeania sp. SIO2H7]|nr:hypothetical protein [Okeania sp. SIO2H7]
MGEKNQNNQSGDFGIGNMEGGSIGGNAKVAGVFNEIHNFFNNSGEHSRARQEFKNRRDLLKQVKSE